jgi:3-hydroxybutyryl-CoA dehydrogenase
MTSPFRRIGVVGAGAMGRGIVQLYAQSGHEVVLHDTQPAAIDAALVFLEDTLGKLAEKGKLTADEARSVRARISRCDSIDGFKGCDLVIEAIIERLDIKQALFKALEAVVAPDCVLVTNTSSLSVTAIASACQRPAMIAGYHFFNPVPLMKVVEVVRGPRTDEHVIERLVALTKAAGHTPVVCGDTPGFIVNHAGRGFGTEALRVLGEGVADIPTIDRLLREQVDFKGAAFKLGPFELMDLTGLDVSHFVMESIYNQYYQEPRYRPNVIGAQRVAAGLYGRKTREGFYRYQDGAQQVAPEAAAPALPAGLRVWVAPGPAQASVQALVTELGATVETGEAASAGALIVVTPLGLDATTAAAGLDASRVVALDTLFPFGFRACKRRALMTTPATTPAMREAAWALFAADGAKVGLLRDSAGFVAQRVIAMIVAISCDMAQLGVASPADIDAAVRIGLGYPAGPLSMGDLIGPQRVMEILAGMHRVTGDPRCRPSLWLQRRAALGLSLLHEG